MADPTPEEEKLNAYRDLLNRRAVSRSDPAVTEILETCTFVSLWIFDTVVEEWRKQKQEGALFLLKRSTDPEHALFLLNRAGVKNTFLSLRPQEVKLTVLKDGMMAIQHRGEGIQRAIFFGDGQAALDRFYNGIFRICGPPVPLPPGAPKVDTDIMHHATPLAQLQAALTSPPAPVPAPAQKQQPVQGSSAMGQVDDAFHKLFAGLGTVSGSASPSHLQSPPPPPAQKTKTVTIDSQSQTQTHTNAPHPSTTYTQSRTVQAIPIPAPPVPAASSRPPARPDTPPTPPITFSPPPVISNPEPQQSRSPVPQTADQLLSSILGMGSPPPRQPSQQTFPPVFATQPPPAPVPMSSHPGSHTGMAQNGAPPPPQPQQTADGLLNSIMGMTSPPPRPLSQQPVPPLNPAHPSPAPQPPSPPPGLQSQLLPAHLLEAAPSPARARDRPPHLDAPPPSNTPPVTQLNGNLLADHRGLVGDIVVDSLPLNFRPNGAAPDPRLAFKLDLLDLIQRDPGFVEHLYHSFCSRRGAGH